MESKTNNSISIDIPNYSGPLETLLDLAKSQKVDLTKISITILADQFVDYIKNFKDKNPYGGSNKTGVGYGFNTDCNDTWKLGRVNIYSHHSKNEIKLYTCTKLNEPIIINTITIY